jgi:quinone-modifying oxidoreductase subunit QmoC
MAWAAWGMKEQLLRDPDVWLCHHCNDCSTRCPRGGRPGDLLAALRHESVVHYSAPRFLARWVNRPSYAPVLLALPALLLGLALLLQDSIAQLLGISDDLGERIVYSYSSVFPHWLLNSFFAFFGVLTLLAIVVGVVRFWRAVSAAGPAVGQKGILQSVIAALTSIVTHEKFSKCKTTIWRFQAHLCVLFGFIGLTVVTIWVITARFNPLIQSDFVYPFSFLSPWKILANLAGAAVLIGCILLIYDRLEDSDRAGTSTYFDWSFVLTLLMVTFTGFVTEFMHYLRLEPHRHVVYFVHLVFVFSLLIYLPYSKFAHIIYRTTAMVYAEYTGREWGGTLSETGDLNADVEAKSELT